MADEKQIKAFVSELFSSAQGEGIQVGRRQLFIRFCECHRACRYCDTPVARTDRLRIENMPGSGIIETEPNPVSCEQLLDLVDQLNRPEFAHDDLFITGGEPLLQADFLAVFMPPVRYRTGLPVHLETSGDLPDAFEKVIKSVDHVLMDIKLPSVTGEPETWTAHRLFLDRIVKEKVAATIKVVVSAETAEEDLLAAADLIRAAGCDSAVILQPMTAVSGSEMPPSAAQILRWQSQTAVSLGRSVRIIPQCHKIMRLL